MQFVNKTMENNAAMSTKLSPFFSRTPLMGAYQKIIVSRRSLSSLVFSSVTAESWERCVWRCAWWRIGSCHLCTISLLLTLWLSQSSPPQRSASRHLLSTDQLHDTCCSVSRECRVCVFFLDQTHSPPCSVSPCWPSDDATPSLTITWVILSPGGG